MWKNETFYVLTFLTSLKGELWLIFSIFRIFVIGLNYFPPPLFLSFEHQRYRVVNDFRFYWIRMHWFILILHKLGLVIPILILLLLHVGIKIFEVVGLFRLFLHGLKFDIPLCSTLNYWLNRRKLIHNLLHDCRGTQVLYWVFRANI